MEESCRWRNNGLVIILASLQILGSCVRAQLDQTHPLRFWIDEYAFSGGETTILRERIQEAGLNTAQITGESDGSLSSNKGFHLPEKWDVYWTGRLGCMQALPHAMPGHKVSCVPGLHELTIKDRLVARLTQFYGEGAFRIIPRSYPLHSQYWMWRLWLASKEPHERGDMWILKKEVHRGKGVHVLPLKVAMEEAKKEEDFDLVQKYIGNQFTVLGRRFYVRLWAIVTSSFPLRAYLFDGGVVVFGNTTPEDKKEMTSDDFIVNLWHLGRTTEARPWSVAEFKVYLDNLTGSRQSYDSLWREIQRSLGLTFAAGVPSMRFSASQFPVAAASATFEMVGIDFLVDENFKPWLLEVNAVPSMARKVIDCDKQPEGCQGGGEAESVFDVEKERFIQGLFALLKSTAGVNLTEQAKLMTHKTSSLADLLAKWKSNATDLAQLDDKNAEHSKLISDLGWHGTNATKEKISSSKPSKGLDLANSGRELRSSDVGKSSRRDRNQSSSVRISLGPKPVLDLDHTEDFQKNYGEKKGEYAATKSEGDGIKSATLLEAARSQTVGDASNLNKYVQKENTPKLDTQTKEEHDKVLEQHLLEVSKKEIEVALANHFLPLMMVPEAVEYSAEHQSRGHIHPQPAHKVPDAHKSPQSIVSALLLPFKPILGAYGNLAHMLEKMRLGIVAIAPEVNYDVTVGAARIIPGADWIILQFYKLFSYGDRKGTVEAFSLMPKHRLDQQLSDYIRSSSLEP